MDERKTSGLRRQNDRYLKDAFEQNFADFLRLVFPDADRRFDLSRDIEFLDKEFSAPGAERGDGLGNRVADLLAKVQTHEGGEEWVLVHTEIEGGRSADLPFRIFDYWFRIWLKYERDVETVVFFTGGESQPKPSVFETGTPTTGLRFHYQTCDIHRFSDGELMEMENPFSIVVLACRASLLEGKVSDRELNRIRTAITRKMIRHGYSRERTERFLFFLWNILHTSDPEANREYLDEIGKLTKGTIDMNTLELARQYGIEDGMLMGMEKGMVLGMEKGIEKGMEKGIEKEKRSIAIRLKKSGLPIDVIAENVGISVKEVERL